MGRCFCIFLSHFTICRLKEATFFCKPESRTAQRNFFLELPISRWKPVGKKEKNVLKEKKKSFFSALSAIVVFNAVQKTNNAKNLAEWTAHKFLLDFLVAQQHLSKMKCGWRQKWKEQAVMHNLMYHTFLSKRIFNPWKAACLLPVSLFKW